MPRREHLLLAGGCVLRSAERPDEGHQRVLPELGVPLSRRGILTEINQQRCKVGAAVRQLLLRRRQRCFHILCMKTATVAVQRLSSEATMF